MTMDELQLLFADHQIFHSDFQMDHLITARSGGTPYGMYKQALRELHKRYRGLKQLYTEGELLKIDIEELESRLSVPDASTFDKRRDQIKLTQKRMAMEEFDKSVQDTEREFRRFYAQATALKKHVNELTPQRRAELDSDMWRHQLLSLCALDLATTGHLRNNTLEFLASTPKDWREPILKQLNNPKILIAWYENYEPIQLTLPEDAPSEAIAVKQLIQKGATDGTH